MLDPSRNYNNTCEFHKAFPARSSPASKKENAARSLERRVMVEAAGQLIHLFRDGPDYAFILRAGCGACYPSFVADGS
ncbi:MAG: hypothetical protein AUH79_02850 [Betaproteobacteria bacterium 13_1_40CM_4_64_4]|nr:MAG: hypothetical protein AUH79_02850 [Betaproteobacteria bacterium 13_1_40CM_4_64_4]